MRMVLVSALATGVFCAAFAAVVDAITDALNMWQVIALAMVSGFCGSLFASLLLGRRSG
ncbi:MAG: hypothetical protein AAGP08_18490 [Pseudomonadota bacterium]